MAEVQTAGKIVQCIGAVVDVEFPRDAMPKIYDALKMRWHRPHARSAAAARRRHRAHHCAGFVRRPAPRPDCHQHRQGDLGAGGPRDARPHHGRAGQPDRRARPRQPGADDAHPPQAAGVRRAEPFAGTARNRHQGDRPGLPVRQGRQGRPVRRRRRGQDREHDGADQQHRQGALGPVGVRRRGRAHPRRQRLLSRDVGLGRRQPREPAGVEGGDGLRPDERAAGQPPARRADRPDDRRIVPRRRPRRAVLRRQHLPLHAGRYRSVRAAGPHAFRRGLPADAGRGNGPPAGAHHLDQGRLDHLDPGRVRACGRPDRPVARHHLRPPGRHRGAVARHRLAGHLPRGGSAGLDEPPARPERRRRGALQHRPRGAGHAAALQGTARHHRHPGHGRTGAGRQAGRGPRPQDPAFPVASLSTWPRCSPAARASTCR